MIKGTSRLPLPSSLLMTVLAVATLAAGCERPPPATKQLGYRGLGLVAVTNPRSDRDLADDNMVPAALDPVAPGGPLAVNEYKNVKVLTDLSSDQFNRLMAAMTQWVAPEQGCGYCHNVENMADDSLYTKTVARRMLQMTRHINADWKAHVQQTGVTCYTCHRGQPVPANIWFTAPPMATTTQSLAATTKASTIRWVRRAWHPSRTIPIPRFSSTGTTSGLRARPHCPMSPTPPFSRPRFPMA